MTNAAVVQSDVCMKDMETLQAANACCVYTARLPVGAALSAVIHDRLPDCTPAPLTNPAADRHLPPLNAWVAGVITPT
jgi:hypothetical protein